MYKTCFALVTVALVSVSLAVAQADDKPGQGESGMSMADMMKQCMDEGRKCATHLDQASQAKGQEMGKHLAEAKQDMADCMALMHMMEPMHKGDNMMQQCLDHGKQCNIHLYLADRAHQAGKHDEATKHVVQAKQHMTQCLDMMKMMEGGAPKK